MKLMTLCLAVTILLGIQGLALAGGSGSGGQEGNGGNTPKLGGGAEGNLTEKSKPVCSGAEGNKS